MNYKEILKLIKPKVKSQSDKYSWQIYQFINKNKHSRVYFYNKSRWDGSELELDKDNLNISNIFIGGNQDSNGTICGNSLSTIMGHSREKYTTFSFMLWTDGDFIDITDWFWTEYIKLGRCLFDKNHNGWWTNNGDRFTYINNTRKCNWCGQWQHKDIKKVVKIQRKEKWINQSKRSQQL